MGELARRNTTASPTAVESGARHYPLLVGAAWLVAIVVFAPADGGVEVRFLVAFLFLQAARIWVIASLGRFWTTRIISLPGEPLVQNVGLAAVWLYKAARQGDSGAQLVLGSQHLFGWGVRRDLVRAYVWLALAARSDVTEVAEQAISYLDEAILEMTPSEIGKAERLAASWSPVADRFAIE